jgi:hypothetical protein
MKGVVDRFLRFSQKLFDFYQYLNPCLKTTRREVRNATCVGQENSGPLVHQKPMGYNINFLKFEKF